MSNFKRLMKKRQKVSEEGPRRKRQLSLDPHEFNSKIWRLQARRALMPQFVNMLKTSRGSWWLFCNFIAWSLSENSVDDSVMGLDTPASDSLFLSARELFPVSGLKSVSMICNACQHLGLSPAQRWQQLEQILFRINARKKESKGLEKRGFAGTLFKVLHTFGEILWNCSSLNILWKREWLSNTSFNFLWRKLTPRLGI